ncbi:MAG: phosphopantetheinyl transferase, partial [Kiritimatiellia bacterium]
DEAADLICKELRIGGHASEVFRKGRRRQVVAYTSQPVPAASALPPNSIVLITGGGRGISARVGLEIAERGPVTLVLVGRGPVGERPLVETVEKRRIKDELSAQGARITPVAVDNVLAPLRKAEEVRANVQKMRLRGAIVEYVRADLSDSTSIAALIADVVSRYGSLDVIIHGAGAEESRLISDKNEAAWHRVFDGKALGGLTLANCAPPTTKLISMGSVAGRFGNAGQVDYAAANDGLARLCGARDNALHLDWTAWDDVGMAVRGGMKRLLTDRGVDLLPADAGAGLLVDLIAAGETGELIVAGGLGDFLPPPDHPLLDRADHDGDMVIANRRMSMKSDPWIEDHAIDGTPIVPGVMGLELMVAAATLAQPGRAYAGARNVEFQQPAKLHRGEALDLQASAERTDHDTVACTLSSTRTLRTGRVQQTQHFKAEVIQGLAPEVPGLPAAFLPDETWDKTAIYQRFFHGPRFQVLQEIQGVSADAMLAEGAVDHGSVAQGLLTDPLVLEAAFQAAGLHHMITQHEMALPKSIEEVQVLASPAPNERLVLMVRKRGDLYDVDVDTQSGPVLRVRGYAMSTLGPLKLVDRFPDPEWERPQVFEVQTPGPNGAISSATVQDDPHPWLTATELARLGARGTKRRIADRISGRIAAKRALQQLLQVDPLLLEIRTAESGEPHLMNAAYRDVSVSISHRQGMAVAVAARGERVGIDLESVERRHPSFAHDWFSEAERRVIGASDHNLTLAWSAKEAVLKTLGVGLAISPKTIQIIHMDSSTICVQLSGPALDLHAKLGGGALRLVWWPHGTNEIVVQARMVA